MHQSHIVRIVVLLIGLTLTAGCVAVSADRQPASTAVMLAPHLPLLEWRGHGPWGDGKADTCKQLHVYFGNAMAAGYCGEGRETAAPIGSKFAEMAAHFAPFTHPTPAPDAATLDTIAAVVTGTQPVTETYASPDGQWQVELAMYKCVTTGDGSEYAYEPLLLARADTGASAQVDSQLIDCGGLGAYGFEGLCWSPDSRYFYYNTAREGVPDGVAGGLGEWAPPIRQLDVASGMIRELDRAVSSTGTEKDSLCTSMQP